MKSFIFITLTVSLLAGLLVDSSLAAQTLTLRWQKPASDLGSECGIREADLQKAVRTLTRTLRKTGLEVQFGTVEFKGDQPTGELSSPSGLWINNKPLERWLEAQTAFAANGCLTLQLSDQSYQVIPAELIVKAGLTAAGNLLSIPNAAGSSADADGAGASSLTAADVSACATTAACCNGGSPICCP